jgi:uncharacterized protein involved in exopolysaccharide biosynthesis
LIHAMSMPAHVPPAVADALTVPLAVFQLAFSAAVSLALWRLGAWQRRTDGLEARLNDAAGRIIDERFRSLANELEAQVRGVTAALGDVKQRMHADDARLRGLTERDQKIELMLVGKLDQLKDYIRDYAAGKADLERHEATVERRLAQVESRLAALA